MLFCPAALAQEGVPAAATETNGPSVAFPPATQPLPNPLLSASGRFSSLNPPNQVVCHNDNVTGLSGTGSLPAFLAQSDDVTHCMERYWTYFTFGSSSWSQDACTYNAVYSESQTNSFSLKSVLMAILHTPNFTTRVQDQ